MLKKLRNRENIDVVILFLYSFLFFGLLFHAETTVKAMLRGLSICAFTVIPSLFPFMVLSELLTHSATAGRLLKRPASLFSKVFKLPPSAFFAFLFGSLCGFPIGARTVAILFQKGAISQKEAARLLVFCNNTGPAFVVAGIGSTLLGSVKIGLLLYAAQILSAVFLAFFATPRHLSNAFKAVPFQLERRSLAEAISNSAVAALKVVGFISFFSTISILVSDFLKNELLLCIISSFLEVGFATFTVANTGFSLVLKLALLSFSISFAGLSVHLQARAFFEEFPVRFYIYLFGKLCHGVLSALLTLLLFPLFT